MTPFGEFTKDYRSRTGISQRGMARELGISAQFLSALEVRGVRIPYSIIDKFCERLNPTEKDKDKLKTAVFESNKLVEIDLNKLDGIKKDTVLKFACVVDRMSDTDAVTVEGAMRDRKLC